MEGESPNASEAPRVVKELLNQPTLANTSMRNRNGGPHQQRHVQCTHVEREYFFVSPFFVKFINPPNTIIAHFIDSYLGDILSTHPYSPKSVDE